MPEVSLSLALLMASEAFWSGHGPESFRFTTLSSHFCSAFVFACTKAAALLTITAWHFCGSLFGVGAAVGSVVWVAPGVAVGLAVRVAVGSTVWVAPGVAVGLAVRVAVGSTVWVALGVAVGLVVRVVVGSALWVAPGVAVGLAVGVAVGTGVCVRTDVTVGVGVGAAQSLSAIS
jgi:hypothetical protein